MDLIFRPMTLDDLEQVREIDVTSFSLPWPERSFRFELTQNPNSRCWVMDASDQLGSHVTGMIVIWIIVDEAHIGTIAVHPQFRRLKIGEKMLANALLTIFREGIRRVFLEVRVNNIPALEMYRKFGFQLDGVRKRYYKDTGEDALLMSLSQLDEDSLLQFTR